MLAFAIPFPECVTSCTFYNSCDVIRLPDGVLTRKGSSACSLITLSLVTLCLCFLFGVCCRKHPRCKHCCLCGGSTPQCSTHHRMSRTEFAGDGVINGQEGLAFHANAGPSACFCSPMANL
jgi:hypothetical protein